MPYFLWRGIDLTGTIRRGKQFARSKQVLEKSLLNNEIALLASRLSRRRARKLSNKLCVSLCDQIATLLEAGLRLAEALDLASKTMSCKLASTILADCGQAVREGIPLHKVLECHVPWIDSLMISLVVAGEESGALARTFRILSVHYEAQEELARKCKSALIMPAITFAVFVVIAVALFVLVIPRFEALFIMLNKPLPGVTRGIFAISSWLRSRKAVGSGGLVVVALVLAWHAWRWYVPLRTRENLVLSLPWVGKLVCLYGMTFFLQTLSVLLDGGVHLVTALALARRALKSDMLVSMLSQVEQDVEKGEPLSSALSRHGRLNAPDLVSLFTLGEATGALALMVRKGAELYHKKIYHALQVLATLVSPVVLLLLGFIIGLLVFAVYAPLLSLSRII